MKTMILASKMMIASIASANIGGRAGNSNAYALRGYYQCGPKDGVSVSIDMKKGQGTISGKKQVSIQLLDGGVSNGNASYEFEGVVDGKSFSLNFSSAMGAKTVRFTHPGSGKAYVIPCDSAANPSEGF